MARFEPFLSDSTDVGGKSTVVRLQGSLCQPSAWMPGLMDCGLLLRLEMYHPAEIGNDAATDEYAFIHQFAVQHSAPTRQLASNKACAAELFSPVRSQGAVG